MVKGFLICLAATAWVLQVIYMMDSRRRNVRRDLAGSFAMADGGPHGSQ